jgi:two-component system NtrC family sensor kinase
MSSKKIRIIPCWIYFLIFFIITIQSKADSLFVFSNTQRIEQLSGLYFYEDVTGKLEADEVLKKNNFKLNPQPVTNLGISNSSFWVRLKITNESKQENLIFGISNPILDEVDLYEVSENGIINLGKLGDKYPYLQRIYNHQFFLFDISVPSYQTKTYLLRVKSWEQVLLPLFIGTPKLVMESNLTQDLIFGIFFGIMLGLVLYNLFIYFTVRDSSYLFYVTYIFLISLVQASLNGYTLRFLFPENPEFANRSLIIFNSLAGLASIRFIQLFMDTKKYIPTLNKGYYIIAIIYFGGVGSSLLGAKSLSYNLMDLGGFLISFYTLFIAIKIALKGSKPAKLFLLAWSVFLIGVILFVLKNVGVLPSNSYTNNLLTIGVATEGILLSIALATRINDYKKDKEISQAETLKLLTENERIIKEQNVILENRVQERTAELEKTNRNLKEAQSQLVDAEKMASLGQLTAGISHEINNPINFVVANIKPLKRDVQEILMILDKYSEITDASDLNRKLEDINALKKKLDSDYLRDEINQLLKGIDEGANRTSEIVKGLKNFARSDEADLKKINIHEGIDATLTLLNYSITNNNISVVKNYTELPPVECYPGKINQVLMNLLSNAIDALKSVKKPNHQGSICIETKLNRPNVIIIISDNGTGIPASIISKIFDPFYTTKDVGEGTGLGLSIVYGIIKSHNGKIEVQSEENKNTTFTITLPLQQ